MGKLMQTLAQIFRLTVGEVHIGTPIQIELDEAELQVDLEWPRQPRAALLEGSEVLDTPNAA